MFDKVNTLFESIRPFKVAHDLGCICFKVHGVPAIKDPFSTDNIYITESGFVSQSKNAGFNAGNIVDLMVYVRKITYVEAVTHILDVYGKQMDNKRLMALAAHKTGIAQFLKNNRALFLYYQSLRSNLLSGNQPYGQVQQILQHFNLSPMQGHSLVASATKQEAKHLWRLAKALGASGDPTFSAPGYMVMPYWINEHTIGAVSFVPTNSKNYDRRPLEEPLYVIPSRHYFFGLCSFSPVDTVIYTIDSVRSLLEQYTLVLDHAPDINSGMVCVVAHKDPDKLPDNTPDLRPLPRGLQICDRPDVGSALSNNRFFRDFRIVWVRNQFKTGFATALPFRTLVQEQFHYIIKLNGEASDEMSRFLEVCRKDKEAIDTVRDISETLGMEDLLQRATVQANLTDRSIEVFGKYSIRSTADGYQILKGMRAADPEGTLFTNYTLTLDTLLTFKEFTNNKYYQGLVHVDGQSFPFEISRQQLYQGDTITAAAEAAVHRLAVENELQVLPALLDRTYMTLLGQLTQHMSKSCPTEYGLSRLGWSETKDSYYGVNWAMDENGFMLKTQKPYPEATPFKSFHFDTPYTNTYVTTDEQPLSATAVEFCNYAAGMILGGYIGIRTPLVRVLNTQHNMDTLFDVLSLFRQKDLIVLPPNRRASSAKVDYLYGYPFVCFCSNPEVYERFEQHAFALMVAEDTTTAGVGGAPRDRARTRRQATRLLKSSITRLVNGNQLIQVTNIRTTHELATLGSQLLHTVDPEWQVLDANCPAVGL
jgi:hypothetical protein